MLRTSYLTDGWEFAQREWTVPQTKIGYSFTEWLPADVPGSVHLDLQRNGVIPDPHERMNEIGVQWVDDQDWSYRCRFEFRPDPERPRRVLRFDGLDTIATVYLNDEELGRTDNGFLPHEFDVTERLATGENELRIEFESPVRVGNERRATYFAEQGLSDPVSRLDERAFVRKMQCAFGWDWGPRLASCGLTGPVSLIEYEGRISEFSVRNTYEGDSVTIALECVHDGPGELEAAIWPSDGQAFDGVDDESAIWRDSAITLRNLRHWHPVGGPNPESGPVRYEMSVTLRDGDRVLDEVIKTVGFSHNRLLRQKDEVGESFEFEINGRRMWIRGANWIPDFSFPGAITKDRLRARLEQAVELGCNMLRVWGGGLYESDDFYDLCDELGILVWQDFPFACGYYPDDGEYAVAVEKEARYHLRRLRHRPCLALWCGNNENLQMWEQRWGGQTLPEPPRFYGERFYDDLLPRLVAELDPAHDYIPTSPVGPLDGSRGVPDSNGGKVGDSHYWDVWHGRGDWRHYADSDTRFSSEYGFASSCSLPTWEAAGLVGDDWAFDSPTARWHDKTLKGYDTFRSYVRLHYPEPATMEDWVYYSQLNQRDAMRHGVEHFRRFEPCRGSLIWQLNDIWPTQSWALVDSEGVLKPAAYELKRLYADRLLSLVRRGETMEVHAVNDGLIPWSARVVVGAYDLETGELRRQESLEIERASDSRGKILDFDLVGLPTSRTLVVASCAVSEIVEPVTPFDMRTWRLLVEPKEARFTVPAPILASASGEGVLALRFGAPAVDVVLTVDGDPRPFESNAFTVPEPGVIHIGVDRPIARFEARSLSGEHPVRLTRSPLT